MKKPDQSPEAFRTFFENEGMTVTEGKIFGFIDETMRSPYQPPSEENTKAAAALLFEMVQAAKYGQSWDQYKKRVGVRKAIDKGFDPSLVTIDDPAFGLIMAHLSGTYTYEETIELFAEHIYPASDRQIERWIAAIRPRVENTLSTLQQMKALADKK